MRIIGIDVPGFGVPTHAEAKDVLAGAMLKYARNEAEQRPGAGAARRRQRQARPLRCSARCSRRIRSGIGMMLEPLGLAAGPVVPTREWRELYAALDCAVVAAIHPFYTASFREFEAAGRPIVGSAPVGYDGTAAWLEAIGAACNVAGGRDRAGQEPGAAGDPRRARRDAHQGPHHAVRLRRLRAAGGAAADRERRGRALRRHGLPADPLVGRRSRMAGGQGRRRCSTAPRSSRIWPRWTSSSRTWRSAPRRSCRRPRSARYPRCTSPI